MRGNVVDGRIRKKGMGWVSTGVSWLVWWANVCLLAASEPVNHYGPRKRLRPPSLSLLALLSLPPLSLSLRPHSAFSLFLQPHSSPFSHPVLSLTRFLSVPFPFPFISRSLSRTFVPFISLSTEFTPLLRATSMLQCCPPPPILHI